MFRVMGSRITHEVLSGMTSHNLGMLGNEINYGIKTGFNKAFIIDNRTCRMRGNAKVLGQSALDRDWSATIAASYQSHLPDARG